MKSMRALCGLLTTAALLLAALACGPSDPIGPAGSGGPDTITAAGLLADVEVLSDDALGGRGTGTEGEIEAARYIAERFEAAGLAALDGDYRQEFELVGTKTVPATATIEIVGANGPLELADGENVSYWSSSQKPVVDIEDAPLVFVGYGVQAPEYGWDDYKGQDVGGKVLLFLNDDPPITEDGVELFGGIARTYYGRWSYKFEVAMELGAAGAIVVHTTPSASYPWSVVQYNGAEEHFALDLEGSGYKVDLLGWLDEATSGQVAAGLGTDVEGLFDMAASRDFTPQDTGFRVSAHIETEIRRTPTANVVGYLEGSDPELANEVIVFTAHYDHMGTNPDLEDPIFNGAWDNASGTAGIMALADAFGGAEERPKRSLLFLACAAEERGLLGSQWFVEKPPIALNRFVANLNVDMPQIFGVTKDIAAIGEATNSLGATLKRIAGAQGIEIIGDTNPRAGSFYRSDQVNFAKAGIPALFILPGRDYDPPISFDPAEYRRTHYHQASDEIRDEWNLAGLERDLKILYEVAVDVGNAAEKPRWVEGNEFEEAWKKLHGE